MGITHGFGASNVSLNFGATEGVIDLCAYAQAATASYPGERQRRAEALRAI